MENETGTKRDAPLSIRIPRHLWETFLREWQRSGLSKNGYILKCIFGANAPRATRIPRVEKEMLALMLARSAAIRDALDEAIRAGNGDARIAEAVEAATAELEIIVAAAMKMLGRGQ